MGVLIASPEAGDASVSIISEMKKHSAISAESSKNFIPAISERYNNNQSALMITSNYNSINNMDKDACKHTVLMENSTFDKMSSSRVHDSCQFPYYSSPDAVLVKDVGISCMLLNQDIPEIPIPETRTLVASKHAISSQYIDSKGNLCLKLRLFSNAETQCDAQESTNNFNNILCTDKYKLNPLLCVEALDYNDIFKIFDNMSKCIVEASIEQIKLRIEIEGGSMKFAINFIKGTSQDFWEIITKPLCISSMEIIRQHKFLLDLMKKKDEEIGEYKAEGAELIRTIPTPNIVDCTNAFQRMVDFYNELNLYKCTTTSREPTRY
ncbi:hypothetical protein WN48_04249, partial [Eufriesea mexicana]